MIKGVIENNRPLITIAIGWENWVSETVALVDTGFTGDLKISPDQVKQLGLEITHTEPVTLADERMVNLPASLAAVSMEGKAKVVSVIIAEGMTIVGVELLKRFNYALEANFRRDKLILKLVS